MKPTASPRPAQVNELLEVPAAAPASELNTSMRAEAVEARKSLDRAIENLALSSVTGSAEPNMLARWWNWLSPYDKVIGGMAAACSVLCVVAGQAEVAIVPAVVAGLYAYGFWTRYDQETNSNK